MVARGRLWIALLALAPAAFCQTSLTTGALEGVVADTSGARVPGAAVVIRDPETHFSREALTDAEGVFRFEVPPALYLVQVHHPGLAAYRHAGVTVALGSTVRLEVVLQSATVTTQVTVTDQPPPIDPAQISMRTAVDTERIEELPVESRNYLNFVKLAPGVSASEQQPGQRSLAPLADSGFTFGGLRGRSNNLTIDGAENNDEYTGASRTELSLETVQEFQVVNSGVSAESGGASGGAINVITRVGVNAIHGDAFVFLEDGAVDARNPFETGQLPPELHKERMGLALGGPIVRDRTFYYAAFEQEHNRALDDSFLAPDLVAAVNRILGAARVSDARFPTSRAETEASVKVNHQLTARNSVMLRYAFTNNRESGDAFNTLGWFDAGARGSSFTRDHDLVGALTTAISPQSVGEFRVQFAQRQAVLRTNDTAGPGVDIAGIIEFGRPYEGNGRRVESHQQGSYTYSYARGHHLWKTGVAVNRVREDALMADGFGGYAIYPSLADFAAGPVPSPAYSFRQAFGSPATNYAVTNYGGFVQDHWSAAPHVTVDFGVRYDFESLPAPIHEDTNNISPRVGVAWQFAKGWVMRSAYGIFYDRYVLAALNRVLQKNGVNAFERVNEFYDTGLAPSIYRADPNLATPYSQQASFAVEHQLARDITASISYLFVRGIKLARTRNVNALPQGLDVDTVFSGARIDPRFDAVYQLEDSASSTYHGVSFALNRRMSDELEFSAGYTFSKTIDDASDFGEQPQNPLNLRAERALSLQDQRHRLVFNALWDLPIGEDEDAIAAGRPPQPHGLLTGIFQHIEVAPIFSVESGRPQDPLTGVDSNFSLAFPPSTRPLGFNRNSLSTPTLANMDFRVLKYFPFAFSKTAHLDLVAEAFNLFNHTNITRINPVYGLGAFPQPGFLQPLAGAGARQVQFSLDFEF